MLQVPKMVLGVLVSTAAVLAGPITLPVEPEAIVVELRGPTAVLDPDSTAMERWAARLVCVLRPACVMRDLRYRPAPRRGAALAMDILLDSRRIGGYRLYTDGGHVRLRVEVRPK